jgi:hypothetical protein
MRRTRHRRPITGGAAAVVAGTRTAACQFSTRCRFGTYSTLLQPPACNRNYNAQVVTTMIRKGLADRGFSNGIFIGL